jgi:hypothetical protein
MSDEFSDAEKIVEEVLIDLMTEREMSNSASVQYSSARTVQSSPSTARRVGPSRPSAEKRTKHKDNLVNANLIPTILPNHILPLAGGVNHDSVPRDFEYTMVTVYLPKGICAVRAKQDKITTLKFNDFKLRDHKIYGMLAL